MPVRIDLRQQRHLKEQVVHRFLKQGQSASSIINNKSKSEQIKYLVPLSDSAVDAQQFLNSSMGTTKIGQMIAVSLTMTIPVLVIPENVA